MQLCKGLFFRSYKKIYTFFIRQLWKSQRKLLKHIGIGSSVLNLPNIVGYRYISIGDYFYAGRDVRIEAWDKYLHQVFDPEIIIGNNVTFTDRCYLSCISRIEIGDGVLLGRDVFITDNSHGETSQISIEKKPILRDLTTKGPVKIGNNVWVGRQVTIFSGVSIGENSIIGANSVVNKSIPANCVAVGNPAVVIKEMVSESNS